LISLIDIFASQPHIFLSPYFRHCTRPPLPPAAFHVFVIAQYIRHFCIAAAISRATIIFAPLRHFAISFHYDDCFRPPGHASCRFSVSSISLAERLAAITRLAFDAIFSTPFHCFLMPFRRYFRLLFAIFAADYFRRHY
jgi:hypothetical protein